VQQVKGSVLKSRLGLAENMAGPDGLERVLGELSEDDRAALKTVVSVGWYPFDLARRLDDALVKVVGKGDARFFERLGEASAEQNLTGVHRSFLAPGDPHAFLRRTPQIYQAYYDTGRREYEAVGEREAVLTTHDADTSSANDCATVVGWYRKALEMCGADRPQVVEEACRARGDLVCRYRLTWH
jgi:uncharacterized protein (TIGR02265 family)